MKRYYFSDDNFVIGSDISRSGMSKEQKQLLDGTKKQILESIKSGKTLEGQILSDLSEHPELFEKLFERFGVRLTLTMAYDFCITELLCEGKVVKFNNGNFDVPTTKCEKSLAKRLVRALYHYNPQ